MRRVYFGADNIITSLGFSTEENIRNIGSGISGIRLHEDSAVSLHPAAFSAVDPNALDEHFAAPDLNRRFTGSSSLPFSRLEKMLLISLSDVINTCGIDMRNPRTLLIISSTKGNIDRLALSPVKTGGDLRLHLWKTAGFITQLFNCYNLPIVVSNACTSGSAAIITAARLIQAGKYDHVVVAGGDIVTEFVISGFQSFQALSMEACKPFDLNRTGLSLGEGCGTLLLTCDPEVSGGASPVEYLGGATSNDANHISGPSRDGEGLYLAIKAAMEESGESAGDIEFISAHGTATPYNDEMESLALARAGLENVPVNSFKGYFGHTLGAAGIIETILTAYSIRNAILFKSTGYQNHGVSKPLNIISQNIKKPINTALKTASGFGGCNAAIILGNSE